MYPTTISFKIITKNLFDTQNANLNIHRCEEIIIENWIEQNSESSYYVLCYIHHVQNLLNVNNKRSLIELRRK